VKTLFPVHLGGRRTITRASIVDPRASNSLAIFRNRPFFEFSHSLDPKRLLTKDKSGLSLAAVIDLFSRQVVDPRRG